MYTYRPGGTRPAPNTSCAASASRSTVPVLTVTAPLPSPIASAPFAITIDAAAAPHASLAFMFWGAGLFVFPLMLVYAAVNYSVFHGKVRPTNEHY